MVQQSKAKLAKNASIVPGDNSSDQPLNISLTPKEARAIEEFFQFHNSDETEELLDLMFICTLRDSKDNLSDDDYLLTMGLKKIIRLLERISKQLNP